VPIEASAVVGNVTSGSINSVTVTNPSNGFRLFPNSAISLLGGGGTGANLQITLIDASKTTNVTLIASNTLGGIANTLLTQRLGNTSVAQTYTGFASTANTNSRLIDALTFQGFTVGPIATVTVVNGGQNFSSVPTISAESLYTSDRARQRSLRELGILSPIIINNGGSGYANNETISIIGGTGFGAYANIKVNATGSIISANYVYANANTVQSYPLGGMGYKNISLPSLRINTTSGSNANVAIYSVLGDGSILGAASDKGIGQIINFVVTNSGEDYVSFPNVSLKVADIAVSNLSILTPPARSDIVYQGTSLQYASYSATVNSYSLLYGSTTAKNIVYTLRVYGYTGVYDPAKPLLINKGPSTISLNSQSVLITTSGNSSIKIYGDGSAKANVSFLNGVATGQGTYLNKDGQLSSLGLVLESVDYNNYTYILSAEKAISSYRDSVLNLVHPAGTKLIGRNVLKTQASVKITANVGYQQGHSLAYLTVSGAYANLKVNLQSSQISTNTISLGNLLGFNIANTIFKDDTIKFLGTNGITAYSKINLVDAANNNILITNNVFLTFANVAYANASSNLINITSITGQYDGNFTNPTPANAMISIGDSVSFNGGNYCTVTNIYSNNNFRIANASFTLSGNSLITLNKNSSSYQVYVYGQTYTGLNPQLTTESDASLTTESNYILLVG